MFLKRVSEQVTVTRMSRNKCFSVDVLVNEAIQKKEWMKFLNDDTTAGEAKDIIVVMYQFG